MTERLRALVDRLLALREVDVDQVVFGAAPMGDWGHRYALEDPLDESALAGFEAKHGVVLPVEYRAFLRHVANGGAGPFYGLEPLAELVMDELPTNAVEVKLDDEVVSRHATGPREVPSVPSSLARPFPLEAPWAPSEGPLPVALGQSPYDGCVRLAEQGCGYFDFLVVNGPRRGEVWSDYTAGEGPIRQAAASFLDWYEAWLDRAELEWLQQSAARLYMAHQELDGPHPAVRAYAPRLREVLEGAPDWADGWRAYAYAAMLLGERVAAREAFERARSAGGDEPQARACLDRVRVALKEGRFEDALSAIDEGLGQEALWFSTRSELQRSRVPALDGLGRGDEALDALRQLAEAARSSLDHHYQLAWRLLRGGDDAAAVRVLMDAVERDVGPGRDAATRDSVFVPFLTGLEEAGHAELAARMQAAELKAR